MIIASRFDGHCNRCGAKHLIGTRVEWDKAVRGVSCLTCLGSKPPAKISPQAPPVVVVQLAPAYATLVALEEQFVRMAAKKISPDIDSAWIRYEKVKALATNSAATVPERRVALKMAIVGLVTAIFEEESSYVV